MVLVVYLNMRPFRADPYDCGRLDHGAPLSKNDQRLAGVSHHSFHEKYGHVEICPSILRQTLVESRDCEPYCDRFGASSFLFRR